MFDGLTSRGRDPRIKKLSRSEREKWVRQALALAEHAFGQGFIPAGAIIVENGEELARAMNETTSFADATKHAELKCLEQIDRQRDLSSAVLYTTLSPCGSCAQALFDRGIRIIVIGDTTHYDAGVSVLFGLGAQVYDHASKQCRDLMTAFVNANPELWGQSLRRVFAAAERAKALG